jgi:hypothetical protein
VYEKRSGTTYPEEIAGVSGGAAVSDAHPESSAITVTAMHQQKTNG